ncbi:MAG: hypothetical protein WCT01_00970 [Candidatus Shapirobacteria bacterium]|jgi:hypothetical protein
MVEKIEAKPVQSLQLVGSVDVRKLYVKPAVVYETRLEIRAGSPVARPEDLKGNNPPDSRYG